MYRWTFKRDVERTTEVTPVGWRYHSRVGPPPVGDAYGAAYSPAGDAYGAAYSPAGDAYGAAYSGPDASAWEVLRGRIEVAQENKI